MVRSKRVLFALLVFGVVVMSHAYAEESLESANERLCQQEAIEAEGLVEAEVEEYVAQCVAQLQAEQDAEESESEASGFDVESD